MPQAAFVHFPHPGREHNPGPITRQPWNTKPGHRRKFLRNAGQYVAADGSKDKALLAFWAEWEAPSYVIQQWPAKDDLPQFLQEPRWERPDFPGFRQNTDPWVFGDHFRYSNCHQMNQSALRNLAPGSVILFGSTLGLRSASGPRFVLDTLFVVTKQRQRFTLAKPPNTEEAFRVCTVEALGTAAGVNASYTPCGGTNPSFTLYSGATHEAPHNGMYSFVPCKRADAGEFRFARPTLSLPVEAVNPKSTQTPMGAGKHRYIDEILDLWAMVRDQVLGAGCLLGVQFSTPPEDRKGSQPPVRLAVR